MSSRWPQGQQNQRSGYATYDEGWSQDDGDQSWHDSDWQAPDQFGYAGQWPSAQGPARPAGRAAQAVADPRAPARPRSRGGPDSDFQREWDQGAGGFGDDDDLEWISYLTGGRPVQPKPGEAPPQRRSSGRQQRSRSRLGKRRPDRDDKADPGPAADLVPGGQGPPPISAPFPTQPARSRREAPDRATDRRKSRHGRAPDADTGPATDPGRTRPAAAGPRDDRRAVAGWPAAADSGYQLPTLDDAQYGHQSAQQSAAAHPRYEQAEAASWSAVTDSGYDQAALAGWPAVAEPRHDEVAEAEPTGWPEAADPRFDRGSAAGWPAVESRADHGPVAGWPSVDSDYDHAGYDQAALAGWPAVAEPRHDEEAEPTGWPEAPDPRSDQGSAAGWPEPDDTRFGQGSADGWPPADFRYGHAALADTGYDQAEPTGWPATEADFAGHAPVAEASPVPAPARERTARKPAKQAPPKKRNSAKAAAKPQQPRLLADPEPGQRPARQAGRPKLGRRRMPVKVIAIAGAAAAVAAGAAGAAVFVLGRPGGGPAHTVTTPATLGSYTRQPQLALQMHAATLRQQIITESAGEANNVVYAVYQNAASSGSSPQIILFIGGNLSGTSAGSFISTFTGKLQGAVTTSAGPLGGAAACVPSVDGRVAECVWADDDTFGVVASQALGTTGLANEMRQMRPLVEHRAIGS